MLALIASAALTVTTNLAPIAPSAPSAPRALAASNALSAANAQRPASVPDAPRGGLVALQAGTIYLVDEGRVLKGGATILVRGGRILAVGEGLDIPPHAHVVDYGLDAVIVPGFVAATSPYGYDLPSQRTADFAVRALDNFDPYSNGALEDVAAGVTTAYIAPTRFRLVGGLGAVIKLAGDVPEERILRGVAAIDGSITADARNAPGYWHPPVPATVDVGLGLEQQQLPQSTMGAIVALRELVDIARGAKDTGEYGASAARDLRALMDANTPWRLGADTSSEIRALVRFFDEMHLPLIVRGAQDAGLLADEIAAAGVSVVVEVDAVPNSGGRDFGRDDDAVWPRYDAAAKLSAKGVRLAIAPGTGMRPASVRFAAGIVSRGGLSEAAALRAITLGAAEILGVAGRVGSIAPGKDADFVVLNGPPLGGGSSVVATWIDGKSRWSPSGSKTAVVLEVGELYVGDGQVLRPGQILVKDGRIADIGQRVAHPYGAVVVRGAAAMPGMIDAYGHLGLEGSSKTPDPDFKLAQIVDLGDRTDRRVAKAGVTTVMLAPRGTNNSGAPMMAYKPAGTDLTRMVIDDPAAFHLMWTDRNRIESGKNVKELLGKALEYKKKWDAYEEAKRKWVPPPVVLAAAEKKSDDKSTGDAKDEKKSGDDAKKPDESKDEKTDKKDDAKKDDKKGKKEEEGDPINGIWEAKVIVPPFAEPTPLRLRLEHTGKEVVGSVRCASLADDLVELTGTYEEREKEEPVKDAKDAKDKGAKDSDTKGKSDKDGDSKDSKEKESDAKDSKKSKTDKEKEKPKLRKVSVSGLGSRGYFTIDGELDKDGKLAAKLRLGGTEVSFTCERTSKELEYARRPERRKEKEPEKKEIKGEPKAPNVDPRLEPLRRAMLGETAVLVDVDREDEILECVDAFENAGIKPILFGADRAIRVADRIRGRVAGVLPSQRIVGTEPREGLASRRNRYAELATAGIRIAFHSDAEEGAVELPLIAAYAVSEGLGADIALRALTADAADMLAINNRVGRLAVGLDGDVLLLDGPPLEPTTSVLRVWVNGEEVR